MQVRLYLVFSVCRALGTCWGVKFVNDPFTLGAESKKMLSVGWGDLWFPERCCLCLQRADKHRPTVLCTVEILWTFSVLSPSHSWGVRRGWMAELARSVAALIVLFLTREKIAGAGQMGQGIKDLGVGECIHQDYWMINMSRECGRKEGNKHFDLLFKLPDLKFLEKSFSTSMYGMSLWFWFIVMYCKTLTPGQYQLIT